MRPTGHFDARTGRIVLAVPNYSERISNVAQTTMGPPLGLASVAAVLEHRGLHVSIVDANALALSDENTVEAIVGSGPDVVGFTAVTPTADQCGALAREVRRRLPSSLIVMGGVHPTVVPEETLKRFPEVDIVVRGEGDTRLADLLEGADDGRPFEDFEGLCFRDGDRTVSTAPASFVEDLDTLPFPARHLLPMERYVGPDGDRFTTIIGTRGCPGRCAYCSVDQVFGHGLRKRDPRSIVQEMKECHRRFGTKVFGFNDDTFTTDREWVLRLCDAMVASGLDQSVRWLCLTRVDRVDPELLTAMRRAGCFKVELGIESGDQAVLDALGKGTRTGQILDAFGQARASGMRTLAFVMLFSPWETQASLEATKRLVFNADPDFLQASFCTPYPGTRLAEACRSEGIKMSDDWREYVFLTQSVIDHPRFSGGEMIAWQKRLLRSFYFRPRTILRLGTAMLWKGGLRGFLRTARIALRSLLNA